MYKFYNPNPAGNMVRDCVVRAISKAEDQSWDKSYWGICISGFVYKDMPDANKSWGKYLQSLGYKRGTLPNTCPDCYTAEDFATDHQEGTWVLGFGSHVATVKDGILFDSWDSSAEIPQFYWTNEEG